MKIIFIVLLILAWPVAARAQAPAESESLEGWTGATQGLPEAAPGQADLTPARPDVDDLLNDIVRTRVLLDALKAVYEYRIPRKPFFNAGSGPLEEDLVLETVFFRRPDRIRLNLAWPGREEVFLAVNMNTLVMVGDQATDTPWPQPFLLYRLLLEPEANKLKDLLKAFEFNLNLVSVDEQNGVYVLGAEPGDLSWSQAWFEIKEFRLTRLILASGPGRPGYDLVLSDYGWHEPGINWPHRISIKPDPLTEANRAAFMNLRSFGVNPQVEQEAFDLEEIKSTVAPAPAPDAGTQANPDLIKIRKMMEWAEKKLE